MPYALRNTLILIALLICVVTFTLVNNFTISKKMHTIKATYEQNQSQLDNLKRANPDMKDQDVLVQSLEELEKRVKSESRLIAQDNNPTITYAYFLDICENYCPDLKFDFKYVSSGQIESTQFNSYSLIGTGPLTSLYTFIYQLENQFMLYLIDSIRLSGVENEDSYPPDYVYFTLVISAFYEENSIQVEDIPFRYLKYKNLAYHLFIPRVHAQLPDIHEQRFLDINKSRMIGLTPDKVFVIDETGRIQVIIPGDKVAYGYLDHINWEDQNASFMMEDTGILKEQIMMLRQYED